MNFFGIKHNDFPCIRVIYKNKETNEIQKYMLENKPIIEENVKEFLNNIKNGKEI